MLQLRHAFFDVDHVGVDLAQRVDHRHRIFRQQQDLLDHVAERVLEQHGDFIDLDRLAIDFDAHGHADVRLAKGRSVVDAVARHGNYFLIRFECIDDPQLLFR